jgi:hypothetical protein
MPLPANTGADGPQDGLVCGSPGEVFQVFLKLGITSFGGPSRILVTSRTNWWYGANGLTRPPMLTWSRSASFFLDRPPARLAFRSVFCAATGSWAA